MGSILGGVFGSLLPKKKATQQTNQTINSTNQEDTSGTSTLNTTGTQTGATTGTTTGANSVLSNGSIRSVAPDWVQNAAKGIVDKTTALGGADPLQYFADANPLQTRAGEAAAGLTGTPWNYDGALDVTKGVANGAPASTSFVNSGGFVDQFKNPYDNEVLKASLSQFDHDAGDQLAQLGLDQARTGAISNSGGDIERAALESGLTRDRNSMAANLRASGLDKAFALSQAEAGRAQGANDTNASLENAGQDRRLSAGGQIANIASAFGGEQRANAGAQADIGSELRDIASEKAKAPLSLAAFQNSNLPAILSQFFGQDTTGASSGTSTGSTEGTTTGQTTGQSIGETTSHTSGTMQQLINSLTNSKSSDPLGDIAKIAQVAAIFASDRRVKRNILRLWKRADGLWTYLFRYRKGGAWWRAGWHLGVMAQEVEMVRPDAVLRHPAGFLMVDYGKLGV